jgi:hypothetical protein
MSSKTTITCDVCGATIDPKDRRLSQDLKPTYSTVEILTRSPGKELQEVVVDLCPSCFEGIMARGLGPVLLAGFHAIKFPE